MLVYLMQLLESVVPLNLVRPGWIKPSSTPRGWFGLCGADRAQVHTPQLDVRPVSHKMWEISLSRVTAEAEPGTEAESGGRACLVPQQPCSHRDLQQCILFVCTSMQAARFGGFWCL